MLTFVSLAFIIFTSLISNVSSHTCVCAAFTEGECNDQPNCCWNKHVPQAGITQGTRGKCRSHKYLQCKMDPLCTITYNDPRLAGSEEEEEEEADTVLSAYNKPSLKGEDYTPPDQDQDNGQAPVERTIDWPFVCREDVPPTTADDFLDIDDDTDFDCDAFNAQGGGSGGDAVEYSEDPIDVSQIEIVAQKLYYAKKERLMAERTEKEKENMVISSVSTMTDKPGSAYESFTGLQIGAGIVFMVLLLAGMIYWQCNKDKMDKDPLNQNGFISLTESKDSYATFNNI